MTYFLEEWTNIKMTKIIPIRDLRDTGRIAELCSSSNEPIFITENSYGNMVIMGIALYEERMEKLEMREKILEGKEQTDSGMFLDGEKTMEEIRKRLFRSLKSPRTTTAESVV